MVSVEAINSVLRDIVVFAKKFLLLLLRRKKLAAGDGQSRWVEGISHPRSATLQSATTMQRSLHEAVSHTHITIWPLLLPYTTLAKDIVAMRA